MRSAYDYIPTLIRIIVMIYILVRLYLTAAKTGRSIQLVFFASAAVACLLADFYWVAFDLLYPMTRMPFAANEIVECAIFLALASSIAGLTKTFRASAKWETVGAVAFTAANVALWIAWSGEWTQDIITGIALGYLLVHLVRHMKQTQALQPAVWKLLGALCFVIILANAATFRVAGPLKDALDIAVCLLMLIVNLYFVVRTILSFSAENDTDLPVSLSFAAYVWNVFFLYMSAGVFYDIANYFGTFSFLLMFAAIRREAVS